MTHTRLESEDWNFTAPLDNFAPTRKIMAGQLLAYSLEYEGATPSTVYTLKFKDNFDKPKKLSHIAFMLDDGYSLKPYYVAGISADESELYIHPLLPTHRYDQGPRTVYFLYLVRY